MKKMVDGQFVDCSPEEIAARQAEDAAFQESKANPPPPVRDPLAEIDALKTKLAATEAEIEKLKK